MPARKGFTLLELIIVMLIVGMLAAVAIPNFFNAAEQTKAQTAQNNLLAILAGEQRYFEDHNSSYYVNVDATNHLSDLSSNLHLSASMNDNFSYYCSTASSPYQCIASDGTDTLTLTPNTPHPISCTPSRSCPPTP